MNTSAEIANLLVVSRDLAVLRSISAMEASNCWRFETASNAWEAMERVQAGASPRLLLLDLPEGDADCLDMLRWMRRIRPALPVVLLGHSGDMSRQEESARLGAKAYLTRPLDERQLATVIESSLLAEAIAPEVDVSSEDFEALGDDTYFVTIGPQMRKVRTRAALLAEANVPVLIQGEYGSGRETIARLMHKLSVRSGFNFVRVKCAALPQDLLERELFGYQTAGTTAPASTRLGKLDLCARGTIFLDEINEMPAALQSNILSVIRQKRFIRPGASGFARADVRIFAASSSNGSRTASDKGPSGELLAYISAYSIHIPPLRERKEGIEQLARYFMHRLARHYGLPPRELSPAIIMAWRDYDWPGNLNEMEHLIKRYLMVGDEELVIGLNRPVTGGMGSKGTLTVLARNGESAFSPNQPGATESSPNSLRSLLKSVRTEAERNAIAMALEKTGGNRKAAARLLKVSYRTVLYKIEEYKMRPPASSQHPSPDRSPIMRRGVRKGQRSVRPDSKPLEGLRKELP